MALVNGTVSVNGTTGAVTGSGFARDIFDALATLLDVEGVEEQAASLEDSPSGAAFASSALAMKQRVASAANALAAKLNTQTKTATVAVAGVMSGASSAVGIVT